MRLAHFPEDMTGNKFMISLRTLFQHSWAETEHGIRFNVLTVSILLSKWQENEIQLVFIFDCYAVVHSLKIMIVTKHYMFLFGTQECGITNYDQGTFKTLSS